MLIPGPPSKPKGPLKVQDVTAEGCKLKWDKPEDDGGAPIEHYLVERMDLESGRWVPVCTTKSPEAEVTILLYYPHIIHFTFQFYISTVLLHCAQ